MFKFRRLRFYLSFGEAWRLYRKFKRKDLKQIHVSRLQHPVSLRDNTADSFTFLEVVLQEAYKLSLDFSPLNIIDGGGNIGLTAAYFASRYPGATIVSFEPDRENFELLVQNTSAYKNIRPMNAGIWKSPTYLTVKDMGWGDNGFIVEETSQQTAGSIRAWSIHSVMNEMNWRHCDIVKLDVEGSEKEIFSENYEDWIPRTRVIIVELHDRMKPGCSKAVLSAINKYDFSLTVAGENLVFINQEFDKVGSF